MPFKADRALQLLDRARQNGRLGHAYLITGPKEAQLEAFATRVLNLVTGQRQKALADWKQQGVVLVAPESKSRRIKIETMRELEHMLNLKAGPLGQKFGVIIDAERMTTEAQNAFLKTLEEPPPGTLLLLLTGKPDELLPTTLSRVIEIDLIAEEGARQFSEHERKLLALLEAQARRPSASLATALGLKAAFEEVLDDLREDIEEEAGEGFAKEKEHYQKTTDSSAYLKDQEEKVKARIEASYLHQRDAMLELLLAWMGDVVRHKVGAESFDLLEYVEATRAVAERSTISEATRRLRMLNKLERHLHTNVNEALALEVCFTQAFG